MDWQACLPIRSVSGVDQVVVDVTADAVLWPEERSQVDIRMLMKEIRDVAKAMVHGCLIADEPDAGAPQKMHLLQPLYSQYDVPSAVWTIRWDRIRSKRLNPTGQRIYHR